MKTKLIIVLTTILAISFTATAQPRKHAQKGRVSQGIKSGEVTKKEAGLIREERKELKQEVKQAKADGVVTTQERKAIKEERREADKVIRRAKHNNKTRL